MKTVILLFVLLYPAAFIGGMIQGKMGLRYRILRAPISIGVYIALVLLTLSLTG